MAGRDQGFTDFVDTRAPALWPMATLLEREPDVAQGLLVGALADVRRRWGQLGRDGGAEHEARLTLAARFVRGGRAEDPSPSIHDDDGAGERRAALFTLTAQQRVLLVLSAYTGTDDREIARVADVKVDEVAALTGRAEAAFRAELDDASSTRLLSLLDDAALHDVPPGLTAAVLAARPSRRGRVLVGAGVLVGVVAIGVALSPLVAGSDPADAQAAVKEWGVPALIDKPSVLPSLLEAPIGRASAAVVVDGTPLVIDASSGDARAVFDATSDLAAKAVDRGGHGLIRQNWTQVVLSPDGERLLLVRPRPEVSPTLQSGRSTTGELFVVDIDSGDVTPIEEMNPTPVATAIAGIAQPRLAWAPDSRSFACACSGTLSIALFDDDGLGAVNHTAREARAVAWGVQGPAVADRKGGWSYTDLPAIDTSPFIYAPGLAIADADPTMYLEVSARTIYALGADDRPDGGHCTLWDADLSSPVEVLSVAERGGTLCTPMTLQPGRDGFVLVVASSGPDAERRPFDVVAVDREGKSEVISSVPRATTAASFAAELVG